MSRITQKDASQRLISGEVVAVPTETVYGLAASLNHPEAIERIYTLKKRPSNNPLIIHVANMNQIKAFCNEFPLDFLKITKAFWPGSLTIVLPIVQSKVPAKVRAGLSTAAFRVPSHPLTQQLLKETGPLVMPSANLSGKPSSTCPDHIEHDFGPDFPVLDGGRCKKGVESTIIRFSNKWEIIRLGSLSAERIEEVLGYLPKVAEKTATPVCPGQLYKHYAPNATLHLDGNLEGIVVGYSNRSYPKATKVFLLGDTKNPEEIMQNLYSVLRDLDKEGVLEASVDLDVPENGLWRTLKERLQRASVK